MNKIMKDTLILTLITLVAGLLLGLVYEITKEPIAKQQELTKQESYKSVFADAFEFSRFDVNIDEINEKLSVSGMADSVDEILEAIDENGENIGYVMKITSSEGYGGTISFVFGIKSDGMVNGIEYLSISETAGLGMKAKDAAFKDQFNNKNVETFVVTKSIAAADNEIDAISGATITSNAVTNGVNAGILAFQSVVEGGTVNE